MKIDLNIGENGIYVPGDGLLDRLEDASECEIKTLILVCSGRYTENGVFSESRAAEALGCEEAEIRSALQFWRGAGIFGKGKQKGKTKTVPAEEPVGRIKVNQVDVPLYSGKEITELFAEKPDYKFYLDECQKLAGKMFNALETNKMISLCDYFGLSFEYVMTLYAYCANQGKTTVQYVEKTALNLLEDEVDTLEKLESYIKQKEEYESKTGKIRSLFGIGQRALIKKEKDQIYNWTTEWKMPFDVISYAYELTVRRTGKASMSYANSILESWHASDITDLSSAMEEVKKHGEAKAAENKTSPDSTFDTDEFFEAALKKSYDKIGK